MKSNCSHLNRDSENQESCPKHMNWLIPLLGKRCASKPRAVDPGLVLKSAVGASFLFNLLHTELTSSPPPPPFYLSLSFFLTYWRSIWFGLFSRCWWMKTREIRRVWGNQWLHWFINYARCYFLARFEPAFWEFFLKDHNRHTGGVWFIVATHKKKKELENK